MTRASGLGCWIEHASKSDMMLENGLENVDVEVSWHGSTFECILYFSESYSFYYNVTCWYVL